MRKIALAILTALSLTAQAEAPKPSQPVPAQPAAPQPPNANLPGPTPEQVKMMQMAMARQMQMMSVLYDTRPSRLGLDATLDAIRAGAAKRGWKVGETQDVQAAMRQNGVKDAKPMKVVQLCPAGADAKLAKASGGKAPALPCRASVFEGVDGRIYVMRMNVSGLAKAMQGDLAKAMAEVGAEEDALYQGILQ